MVGQGIEARWSETGRRWQVGEMGKEDNVAAVDGECRNENKGE
jgi:hypothetical protein